MNAQRDDLLERALAALDTDKAIIARYRSRCDLYEAALTEAHALADEAVHGKAIRFSVCSRIRTLTRAALDAPSD